MDSVRNVRMQHSVKINMTNKKPTKKKTVEKKVPVALVDKIMEYYILLLKEHSLVSETNQMVDEVNFIDDEFGGECLKRDTVIKLEIRSKVLQKTIDYNSKKIKELKKQLKKQFKKIEKK